MNKDEIKKAINTLIMVTGDCPYERGIGKENENCEKFTNCVDCWKSELWDELHRIEKEESKC